MIKSKYIELICIFFSIVAVGITFAFSSPTAVEAFATETTYLYENKIFDDSRVHSIDIVIDENDWNSILENPLDKEYVPCNLVIDGELYKNIAIRTKGNTSLSSVASSDSDRYSLKIEFDHYDDGKTYYGLDKLALNNIIQDSTYLKDYLSYHMIGEIGVASPLSSFVNITVNGECFGLYLAVEGIEDSFVARNFGSENGKLYKPDSMQMVNNQGSKGTRDNSASLKYTDDDFDSYNTIWDGAVFDINDNDKARVIEALKNLNAGEELENAVDVEAVLKYFAAHNFVLNFDSYTGNMLHNYYLYEADGQLSMIPWDYNLAFGSFGGMGGNRNGGKGATTTTSSTNSSTGMVNFPIDTPIYGSTLEERPMLGKLLENEKYMNLYHQYFDEFISEYFESGKFEEEYDKVVALISPYVEKDTTSFVAYDDFLKGVESLKDLCLLRAESIRGQLDGTIPSTTEGQSEDSSKLINAEHISISDTGSMGMGGGKTFNTEQSSTEIQTKQTEQIEGSEASEDSEEISAFSSLTGVELTALAIGQQDETITGFGEDRAIGTLPDNAMGIPSGDGTAPIDNTTETEANNAEVETPNAVEETSADSIQAGEVSDQVEGVRPEWNEGMQMPQGGGSGNFGNGVSAEPVAEETSNTETIILLGASMLVLLFGFAFILRYKRF